MSLETLRLFNGMNDFKWGKNLAIVIFQFHAFPWLLMSAAWQSFLWAAERSRSQPFFVLDLCDKQFPFLLLPVLDPLRFSVSSDLSTVSEDDQLRERATPSPPTVLVSSQSCVERKSLIVESTCCFFNAATSRVNNGSDTNRFKIAFMRLFDFYHRPKHSIITSSTASRLNHSIMIVLKNWAEVFSSQIEPALFPSCHMSTRAFSTWFAPPLECVLLNCDQLPPWSSPWFCFQR